MTVKQAEQLFLRNAHFHLLARVLGVYPGKELKVGFLAKASGFRNVKKTRAALSRLRAVLPDSDWGGQFLLIHGKNDKILAAVFQPTLAQSDLVDGNAQRFMHRGAREIEKGRRLDRVQAPMLGRHVAVSSEFLSLPSTSIQKALSQ